MYKSKSRAFTLIEMMIVISIIGILTVISISSYSSAQRRARDTTRKSQILSIQSALERYRSTNNVYAPDYCLVRQTGNNCSSGGVSINGLGACEGQISTDAIDTPEPAFDVDATSAARTTASGFLLPFMGKPRTQGSIVAGGNADVQINDAVCTFTNAALGNNPLSNGRVRLSIQRDSYWISAVLENKTEKRNPTGATCYKRPATPLTFTPPLASPQNYNGSFLAFNADACGANDNTVYKLFARGNRGDL